MSSKTPLSVSHPELCKSWDYDRNQFLGLTPSTVSKGVIKKVWWFCTKGHHWKTAVYNRVAGNGCPYCTGQKVCIDNCLETLCPELSKQWAVKNVLKPSEVTQGSGKKVLWNCDKGHEWKEAIYNRVAGKGCPYCSGQRVCHDNCLETLYPELSKEWSSKNKRLPSEVAPHSNKKVWWVCYKGHEWKAQVNSRTNGRGCPYCSGNKTCQDNCLETLYPELSKEWAKKNKFGPSEITPGSEKKVGWLCEKGHSWQAAIYSRVNGNGCPYCAGKKPCLDNCLETLYPGLSREWASKNTLKPAEVVPGSNKKVWWVCVEGHSWRALVCNRVRGGGCPHCSGGSISKISQEWLDSLGVEDREVRLKIRNKVCTVDGFDPKTNTVYEFLGDYWHGNPERFSPKDINTVSGETFGSLYNSTLRRLERIRKAGYNVVFIWEKEFKKGVI